MYGVFYKFDNRTQQISSIRDLDETLLNGPSTSGVSLLVPADGATKAAAVSYSATCSESIKTPNNLNEKPALFNNSSPTSVNSSTSTVPLISPPQSPLEQTLQPIINKSVLPSINNNMTTTTNTMPAKSQQPIPVIITATTTEDIIAENRFSLLAERNITANKIDILYSLPSPPQHNWSSHEDLNNSSGTTEIPTTSSASPHKTSGNDSKDGSLNRSPYEKRSKHGNHNNEGDVQLIESLTADTYSEKIPSGEFEWIDFVFKEPQNCEIPTKPKTKKQHVNEEKVEKEELDGVPAKENRQTDASLQEEDGKVIKCLYYTLMCCDCSIS